MKLDNFKDNSLKFFIQKPSHTHSRGLQNITGSFNVRTVYNAGIHPVNRRMIWPASGNLFSTEYISGDQYPANASKLPDEEDIGQALEVVTFDASRSWTGEKIIIFK